MTDIKALPEKYQLSLIALGYYSAPHQDMPSQRETRNKLCILINDGPVESLPEALDQMAEAYAADINGRPIPTRSNWTNRIALMLKGEIEGWLAAHELREVPESEARGDAVAA